MQISTANMWHSEMVVSRFFARQLFFVRYSLKFVYADELSVLCLAFDLYGHYCRLFLVCALIFFGWLAVARNAQFSFIILVVLVYLFRK